MTDPDRTVTDFWRSYVEAGRGGFGYVSRHPLNSVRAFRAIRKLPVIEATEQSRSAGGQEVRRVIDQKGPLGLPARWWGFTVLTIGDDPTEFLNSPDGKRLRRNCRIATAEGISCRLVRSNERVGLLEQANRREQSHPNDRYRVLNPENNDLLWHDLWMIAEDPDGKPLLLAVVAVDGEFAILRYFRTLGDSEHHSLSRYQANQAVVEELAKRGVRWLVDTDAPAAQTNGVRLFQRIVGFRHKYVRRKKPSHP